MISRRRDLLGEVPDVQFPWSVHFAAVRSLKADQDFQQGSFTRPISSHQRYTSPPTQLESNIPEQDPTPDRPG